MHARRNDFDFIVMRLQQTRRTRDVCHVLVISRSAIPGVGPPARERPSLPTVEVVAVLLAAGGGTRFTGSSHKLMADLDGTPVHRRALDAVVAADIGPIVVVTGAADLDLPPDVVVVHNAEWAQGQARSLRAGLATATEIAAVDAVVIGLADQPFIPAEAWRAVASAPAEWPIVVATYDGRRGPNPVRLHRSMWSQLPTDGDEGARHLIRENPQLVCEVPCGGSAVDIDTLEDLKRWTSS